MVTDPALLASLAAAATCITAGPPSLRMITCADHSTSTCQLLKLHVGPQLPPPNGECKDHSCSSILRDQHRCGISAQVPKINAHKWTLIIVPCQRSRPLPATQCLHQSLNGMWNTTWRSHSAFEGVRGLGNRPNHVLRVLYSRNPCQALPLHVGPTLHSCRTFSTPPRSNSTTLHSRAVPHFSRVLWSVLHLLRRLDSGPPVKTRLPFLLLRLF